MQESREAKEFRRQLPSLGAVVSAAARLGLPDHTAASSPRYVRTADLLARISAWATVFADAAADVAGLDPTSWARMRVEADIATAEIPDDPHLSMALLVRRQLQRLVIVHHGLRALDLADAEESHPLIAFARHLLEGLIVTFQTIEAIYGSDGEQGPSAEVWEQFRQSLVRIGSATVALTGYSRRVADEGRAAAEAADEG